jgi:hypothetical protein
MRKMSLLELLFALLLVCLLATMAGVGALVWNLVRRADGQARDVAELKSWLDSGGRTQEVQAAELRERLAHTQSVMEGLRSALNARQPIEEEARTSLKRLENIIAGSSTRGAAGENILEEALRHLPPEMLQRNVWVGGKGRTSSRRRCVCPEASSSRWTRSGSQPSPSNSWPTRASTPRAVPS